MATMPPKKKTIKLKINLKTPRQRVCPICDGIVAYEKYKEHLKKKHSRDELIETLAAPENQPCEPRPGTSRSQSPPRKRRKTGRFHPEPSIIQVPEVRHDGE